MRFLCLHGSGTNNEVFKSQTAAIRYALGSEHSYVFAQGSIPWSMAKELDGIAKDSTECFTYFHPEQPSTYLTAYHQLDNFIDQEGPFDGVIAFSQGAGLAIAYMARERVERPDAPPTFKCAILFSPAAVGDPFEWLSMGEKRRLQTLPNGVKIQVPTVMIWGSGDELMEHEGMQASFELFDSGIAWKYVHRGVHELPNPGLAGSVQQTKRLAIRAITMASYVQNRVH